jgi:hypothetical protein
MTQTSEMKRPWAVVLVAVMECFAAAIAWTVSFSLFVPGTRLDRMWQLNMPVYEAFATQARPVATLLLLVGGLAAAAGVGLLTRRLWAWLLSLAIFGINALGDLVSLLITRDWLHSLSGVVIDAIFLYLLLRPGVRSFFLTRR